MEMLADLKWQDIVAILGLIAGVVTVIAYIDQRRAWKRIDTLPIG